MEGNNTTTKPRALLVFGAPCCGKSTFSEAFSKKFGLAYYDLNKLEEDYGFSKEATIIVLEQILKTKASIVVEGGIDTEQDRLQIRNLLRNYGYEPALVWVQTDVATIRARLKKRCRNVAKAKEIFEHATAEMEAPSEAEKPIILSGKHTFETQCRHVVKGLAELSETKK
ncbi:ATP-binding protein [Candidatus Saccharibacteria bacterium]|nr:ATP-binding protein [Candidatus Saccharibacteria bacterium]